MGGQLLGYSALMDHYALECPPPRRLTAIASVGQKVTTVAEGVEWTLLPRVSRYRVPENPIEHIGVALKHEGVDLRLLNRLFAQPIANELTAYIESNPAGKYTRRAWFIYEWITGNKLKIVEPYGAQYVPVLDPNLYFARRGSRSTRHKVTNNLPGVPGFCPLFRRTERLAPDRIQELAVEAKRLVSDADPAVLRRALGFMLLNESKGSFGIEGERPPRNRLERWGRIIAEAGSIQLSPAALEDLQRSLIEPDQHHVQLGFRQEGGFVGRHDERDQTPIPDHVSAQADDLPRLINSLLEAFDLLKKSKFDPVLTAASIGFGFVFIHPFEDGNGRLHRFLIQKALVDMGFNPEGVILPVSATILEDLLGYRAALEDYSGPTLTAVDWEPTERHNVHVLNETAYLYSYFDATRQAEYLLDRLERTVRFSLPAELEYLRRFDDAKMRLAREVDMPDRLASLLIQFCAQNQGRLSPKKRAKFFPEMKDDELTRLEQTIGKSGIVALAVPVGD